jgi:hypothetical protein
MRSPRAAFAEGVVTATFRKVSMTGLWAGSVVLSLAGRILFYATIKIAQNDAIRCPPRGTIRRTSDFDA